MSLEIEEALLLCNSENVKLQKKMDDLSKWVNESIEHYQAIRRLGALMPIEQCYLNAFESFRDKISNIQ